MHRNTGVHTHFLVVHAPLDLRFALVWGEFRLIALDYGFRKGARSNGREKQARICVLCDADCFNTSKVRHFRLRHQPTVVSRTTAIEKVVPASLFEMTEPPGGWRRAVSEAGGRWAGGGTVLARPGAQLSGRARGVVLTASDAAKRRSGCPPWHLSMPSLMNATSRVRPVRSPRGFGRDVQRSAAQERGWCWSVPSW